MCPKPRRRQAYKKNPSRILNFLRTGRGAITGPNQGQKSGGGFRHPLTINQTCQRFLLQWCNLIRALARRLDNIIHPGLYPFPYPFLCPRFAPGSSPLRSLATGAWANQGCFPNERRRDDKRFR
uniref:Uncharacterized protein n=1 Tax=Rhipicephalus zambeziensis TaxID=60191 RepID=A0A224YGK4_9ACAR